jgi:hypothetical protein
MYRSARPVRLLRNRATRTAPALPPGSSRTRSVGMRWRAVANLMQQRSFPAVI